MIQSVSNVLYLNVLLTPNGNHHNFNPNSETTAEQR